MALAVLGIVNKARVCKKLLCDIMYPRLCVVSMVVNSDSTEGVWDETLIRSHCCAAFMSMSRHCRVIHFLNVPCQKTEICDLLLLGLAGVTVSQAIPHCGSCENCEVKVRVSSGYD